MAVWSLLPEALPAHRDQVGPEGEEAEDPRLMMHSNRLQEKEGQERQEGPEEREVVEGQLVHLYHSAVKGRTDKVKMARRYEGEGKVKGMVIGKVKDNREWGWASLGY